MTNDDLGRLRQAFITTLPSDMPREDCPSADDIWEAVHDQLPPARLREVIQHLSTCAPCTETWRVAQELEGIPLGKALPRQAAPLSRGWARGFAVAAAATLVLTLGGSTLR